MSMRIVLLVAALALGGCGRGGVAFTGEEARAAPQLPGDDGQWLNGRVDLAGLKGQVVLVEAWHPS